MFISVLFFQVVIPISIKSDLVLSYIEQLPVGTKISVREIASVLQISEGTAYKAVKEAENLGYVVVKPKAGTVRVSTAQPSFGAAVLATDVIRLLGLSVLAGKEIMNRHIKKLIICDGSEQSLRQQFRGLETASCLCLCGDRPEIQTCILEAGANLLLTSGCKASWVQINLATRNQLLILASPQSAYSLVRLFDEEFAERVDYSDSGKVAAWMQTPDYLYYNDIIGDWQRLYRESCLVKQYPVVDDNLSLYGGLDLWKAGAAVPSERIRSVTADRMQLMTVSSHESLTEVAKRFILNNESLAAVVDDGQQLGIITSNDLLRYYMYTEPSTYEHATDSFLTKDTTVSDQHTVVYRVDIPESELKNISHLETDLILSASASLLRQAGHPRFILESGTFFASRHITSSEGLILICHLQGSGRSNYVIEAEINDDATSYAKAILVASATDQEEE